MKKESQALWLIILLFFSLTFTSCSSDEPKYADQEAHEKTMQLKEQYGPLVVGTWHVEYIKRNAQVANSKARHH